MPSFISWNGGWRWHFPKVYARSRPKAWSSTLKALWWDWLGSNGHKCNSPKNPLHSRTCSIAAASSVFFAKEFGFRNDCKKFRLANCQFSRLNVVSMVEDRLRQDFDNFRQFRGWGILSTGMAGGIFFLFKFGLSLLRRILSRSLFRFVVCRSVRR